MKIKVIALAAAAVAVLLGAGAALSPAYAYPDDMKMKLTAKRVHDKRHNSFRVRVTRGQPGCTVRVYVKDDRDDSVTGLIRSNGTFSGILLVDGGRGRYVLRAVTLSPCKPRERATTTVFVTRRKVDCPDDSDRRRGFDVTSTGWLPNSDISFTLTKGGNPTTSTARTDRQGTVSKHLQPSSSGTWAVVAAQRGHSEHCEVHVR